MAVSPAPRPGFLCPPVGYGGLPRAGGDDFSLVKHPCQKHLVYKLASASRLPLHSSGRWTDRAKAPGPLPPAPGPRSPCAPLAARPQPNGRVAPRHQSSSQGPGFISMGPQRVGCAGIYRGTASGPALSARSSVESDGGQTSRAEALQPPPAGQTATQAGKIGCDRPRKARPQGPEEQRTQLFFQHMVAVGPGRCLAGAASKTRWGLRRPKPLIPPAWPGCSLSDPKALAPACMPPTMGSSLPAQTLSSITAV